MPLNIPRLQAAITTGVTAGLEALFNINNIQDSANTGNPFYTIEQIATIIGDVVGQEVIQEFVSNAVCTGADPQGGTVISTIA